MKRVASANNPLVKTLRRLAHPRKRETRFLLEGVKLVESALESDIAIETIVVSSAFRATSKLPPIPPGVEPIELDDGLFRSVSSLDSPEGVMAVAERPAPDVPTSGRVAVAAGIQDPGNVGAILRVVEAAGGSALVVLAGTADPFGPKAVRGSMGSVLRVPVVEADVTALAGFRKIALVPRGGVDYRDADWASPVAVVLGGESTGIDPETLSRCDERASIPMKGQVESLNVATAAALVFYEAARRDS